MQKEKYPLVSDIPNFVLECLKLWWKNKAWWALGCAVSTIGAGIYSYFAYKHQNWSVQQATWENLLASAIIPLCAAGVVMFVVLLASPYLLYRKIREERDTAVVERGRQEQVYAVRFDQLHQEIQKAEAERQYMRSQLDERPLRRIEIRDGLGELAEQGELLSDAWIATTDAPLLNETKEWLKKVGFFSKRHLNVAQHDYIANHTMSIPQAVGRGLDLAGNPICRSHYDLLRDVASKIEALHNVKNQIVS